MEKVELVATIARLHFYRPLSLEGSINLGFNVRLMESGHEWDYLKLDGYNHSHT